MTPTERHAPSAFKDFEHAGWQAVSDRYHASFRSLTTQSVPAVVETVGAASGKRLLDLCCGPGYVAAAAARSGADVLGVDFSSSMIDTARRENPALDFRAGDAESLDCADAEFDCVVINYGLLHLARPEHALAEAHRVLRPGGRLACTVWAPAQRAVAFELVLGAIRDHGRTRVDLPEGPDFFRYSDPEACRVSFAEAGFTDVRVRELPQTWRLRDAGELFDAMTDATVRTGGLLRAQDEAALAAIRAAVVERAHAYRNRDGIAIPMPAVLTVAVKP